MMKKNYFLTVFFACLLMSGFVYAQVGSALPVASSSQVQVGIVAAVSGKVEVSTPQQSVGRVVESGQKIYLGDVIKTDEKGSLQIMLMDETVFTVGPKSSIVIDEFVYNPANHDGKITANALQGTFRMITGKIPQKKPSRMKVKLPTGVMAVRGTMVYLIVDGDQSTGILGGPGSNHNTAHRTGSFSMENEVGEGDDPNTDSTVVTKTGSASTIDGPGQSPSPAFDFPQEQFDNLKESFDAGPVDDAGDDQGGQQPGGDADSQEKGVDDDGPRGVDDGPGVEVEEGDSATEEAGQDDAFGFEALEDFEGFGDLNEDFEDEAGDAAEDNAEEDNSEILQGLASIDDLAHIQTGVFHFKETNVALFDGSTQQGSYTFQMDIDFGDRTIGGGNSAVFGTSGVIDGGDGFSFPIDLVDFDSSSDGEFATFEFSGVLDQGGSTQTATADIIVDLINGGTNVDDVANNADHSVTIYEDSPGFDIVDGSGNAKRLPGHS